MAPETFENTFAPEMDHKRLSVDQIIAGLKVGVIRPGRLPPEAQEALSAEMDRRSRNDVSPSRLLLLLLGAMGEVKYKTRLQKYAFLADNQLSRSQKGSKGTDLVYRWKPYHYGPFSEDLDICINEALEANLIKKFEVVESNKDPGVGYKLTVKGNAEYRKLLQDLEGVSRSIHGLLGKFQRDATEHQLIDFVYRMYPEYTAKSRILDRFSTTGGDL